MKSSSCSLGLNNAENLAKDCCFFRQQLKRAVFYLLTHCSYVHVSSLNIYYALTVFCNWKHNVELCMETPESVSRWTNGEIGKKLVNTGSHEYGCGCPVEKMIYFLEEGTFGLSLAGREAVRFENRGRTFYAE